MKLSSHLKQGDLFFEIKLAMVVATHYSKYNKMITQLLY